jgi:hypothetical protein
MVVPCLTSTYLTRLVRPAQAKHSGIFSHQEVMKKKKGCVIVNLILTVIITDIRGCIFSHV